MISVPPLDLRERTIIIALLRAISRLYTISRPRLRYLITTIRIAPSGGRSILVTRRSTSSSLGCVSRLTLKGATYFGRQTHSASAAQRILKSSANRPNLERSSCRICSCGYFPRILYNDKDAYLNQPMLPRFNYRFQPLIPGFARPQGGSLFRPARV